MRVFAIAARAVCVKPEGLEHVNRRLELVSSRLVPPEASAAEECLRLWKLFARVARVPKAGLRMEAGKAFCRDLDALGQRLDLPPLADWDDLPSEVDDPDAIDPEEGEDEVDGLTLAAVQERARGVAAQSAGGPFPAQEAARLLAALDIDERRQLLEQLVGTGLLGRSDVNLLIRCLVKGEEVGVNDTMLIEVLERLGGWLAR